METIEKEKFHDIIIDESLDKLNDVVLFPRKVEEAKREIAKYGLPDQVKKPR